MLSSYLYVYVHTVSDRIGSSPKVVTRLVFCSQGSLNPLRFGIGPFRNEFGTALTPTPDVFAAINAILILSLPKYPIRSNNGAKLP